MLFFFQIDVKFLSYLTIHELIEGFISLFKMLYSFHDEKLGSLTVE